MLASLVRKSCLPFARAVLPVFSAVPIRMMGSSNFNNSSNNFNSAPRSERWKGVMEEGRSVYVGNIGSEISWKDLKNHMQQAGNVAYVGVPVDPNGSPRGYAFVEYSEKDSADKAVSELNKTTLSGRELTVREHVPRQPRSFNAGERKSKENNCFVSNLPWSASSSDLEGEFGRLNGFVSVRVITDASGKSKGCAVFEFDDAQSAAAAIDNIGGAQFMGRTLQARQDRDRDQKSHY